MKERYITQAQALVTSLARPCPCQASFPWLQHPCQSPPWWRLTRDSSAVLHSIPLIPCSIQLKSGNKTSLFLLQSWFSLASQGAWKQMTFAFWNSPAPLPPPAALLSSFHCLAGSAKARGAGRYCSPNLVGIPSSKCCYKPQFWYNRGPDFSFFICSLIKKEGIEGYHLFYYAVMWGNSTLFLHYMELSTMCSLSGFKRIRRLGLLFWFLMTTFFFFPLHTLLCLFRHWSECIFPLSSLLPITL